MDHPFWQVVEEADALIKAGHEVHQKFTCKWCRSRQTVETPNVFHLKGICEECDSLTNIEQQGCNYLLIISLTL